MYVNIFTTHFDSPIAQENPRKLVLAEMLRCQGMEMVQGLRIFNKVLYGVQ